MVDCINPPASNIRSAPRTVSRALQHSHCAAPKIVYSGSALETKIVFSDGFIKARSGPYLFISTRPMGCWRGVKKCIDNLSLNHDALCAGSAYFSDLYELYMSQIGDTDGEPPE